MKTVSNRSQSSVTLLLGLLMITPGLYAMDAEQKITFEQKDKLMRAMELGDLEKIEQQLSGITDINKFFSTNDIFPLHNIFNTKTIEFLLARKADVNAHNKFGSSPLLGQCFCIRSDHSNRANECALLLLDQPDIDVNTESRGKETAVCVIVTPESYSAKQLPLLIKLFDRGADPCIVNLFGDTIVELLRRKLGKGNDALVRATVDAWKAHCAKMTTALRVHLTKDPSGIIMDYVGNLEEAYKPKIADWLKPIFGKS